MNWARLFKCEQNFRNNFWQRNYAFTGPKFAGAYNRRARPVDLVDWRFLLLLQLEILNANANDGCWCLREQNGQYNKRNSCLLRQRNLPKSSRKYDSLFSMTLSVAAKLKRPKIIIHYHSFHFYAILFIDDDWFYTSLLLLLLLNIHLRFASHFSLYCHTNQSL